MINFIFSIDGSPGCSPAATPDGSLRARSLTPPDTKFPFPSPTKLSDQKPFRSFDITSLMRKDEDYKPSRPATADGQPPTAATDSPRRSPPPGGLRSPAGTPPTGPAAAPYPNLFNSGLYQQYLTQLIANSGGAGGGGGGPPPALNHMLLQAQLALAQAQSNQAHLLANYPGSAALLSERLKANRFSPYPVTSLALNTSAPPLHSPLFSSPPGGLGSAFKSLTRPMLGGGGVSPPVSPPISDTPPLAGSPAAATSPPLVKAEQEEEGAGGGSAEPALPPPPPSDIKNIEKMINGLNGNPEGRFSLSHNQNISQ